MNLIINNEIYGGIFLGKFIGSQLTIFVYFLIVIILGFLLHVIAALINNVFMGDNEKLSEYECGFEPLDAATRQPFDVHFYIIGLLFLIFDVEVALLFPWAMTTTTVSWSETLSVFVFLFILTIGYVYEWFKGIISWYQVR